MDDFQHSRVDSTVNLILQELQIHLQIFMSGLHHLMINTTVNFILQKYKFIFEYLWVVFNFLVRILL